MLIVRPNRFLATLGGIFFTVFGFGVGYAGWRMDGIDRAICIGMAVFTASAGLHFLYLAANGGGGERISGSIDLVHPASAARVPQRLALLEDLRRRHAISDAEYQQQRARILQDI